MQGPSQWSQRTSRMTPVCEMKPFSPPCPSESPMSALAVLPIFWILGEGVSGTTGSRRDRSSISLTQWLCWIQPTLFSTVSFKSSSWAWPSCRARTTSSTQNEIYRASNFPGLDMWEVIVVETSTTPENTIEELMQVYLARRSSCWRSHQGEFWPQWLISSHFLITCLCA